MDSSETRLRVAGYLHIRDVARFQAIDAATKVSLDVDGVKNVWKYCVESQFEDLFAAAELFEGEDRLKFLRFLLLLERANYALCSPLIIASMEDASFLECRLRKAADACNAHLAASGSEAHMLLGEFDLHKPRRSTMFSFGVEGKRPIAGLPDGFLKMKLVVDGNALWSWAEYGVGEDEDELRPYTQTQHVHFTVSVDSIDPDVFMKYRGVPLVLDGCWRPTMFGVCSNRTSRRSSATVKRKSRLTMCVLSLLDGTPAEDISLMNAMSLDAGQRYT
eukprot:TRINITY_DN49176_c0_g1_i1.p1 TRINITY_DN49176_c0_g1~~TRINITY_DN49176_c0_g1_i1.p1  ORF type:complete len:276 (-),score=39.99 TRINITY_DN49176_c0_g1_i1:439-1266(-)